MNDAFSRAQAQALTQPDPWEPTEDACEMVQAFLESALISLPTPDGETFVECRLCGDVDGHNDGCPLPALQAWLEGEN